MENRFFSAELTPPLESRGYATERYELETVQFQLQFQICVSKHRKSMIQIEPDACQGLATEQTAARLQNTNHGPFDFGASTASPAY